MITVSTLKAEEKDYAAPSEGERKYSAFPTATTLNTMAIRKITCPQEALPPVILQMKPERLRLRTLTETTYWYKR